MDADIHPHRHHDSHRGWVRPGGRRGRWLEPFLLVLIGTDGGYGGALIGRCNDLCLAPHGVDVGMAYRTLRELEAEGLMTSRWAADDGAPRRAYRLTEAGRLALDEWIAVMRERGAPGRGVPRPGDTTADGTRRLGDVLLAWMARLRTVVRPAPWSVWYGPADWYEDTGRPFGRPVPAGGSAARAPPKSRGPARRVAGRDASGSRRSSPTSAVPTPRRQGAITRPVGRPAGPPAEPCRQAAS